MRLGARKVLPKSGALQQAIGTVRRLHQGLPVVTREELEALLEAWTRERKAQEDLRRRLDLLEPWEEPPRMEFALGQLRIMKVGRLAMIMARPAQRIAAEPLDPPKRFGIRASLGLGHRGFHQRFAAARPLRDVPLAFGNDRRELFRQIAAGPLGERLVPSFSGFRPTQPLQQAGAHQQHREIERRSREPAMDCIERTLEVARGAAHRRQLHPQGRIVRAAFGRRRQQRRGAPKIAGLRSSVGV
jgi:hypothetical protein